MTRIEATLQRATLTVACLCSLVEQASAASRAWHVGDSVAMPFARPAIRCEITSLKSSYRVGDRPEVAARLINDTAQAVNLVGSLDDSERKARYPYAYFEVLGPPSGVAQERFFYCGYINALRDADFVEVPPGDQLDPFMKIDGGGYFPPYQFERTRLVKPGTYTILFRYSTDSDDLSEWNAEEASAVAGFTRVTERLRMVPRVSISCSLEVRVNE